MSNIKVPGWIKVTSKESGFYFYINSKLVTDISELISGGTLITYSKDHCDTTKETPEEVMKLIKESYND